VYRLRLVGTWTFDFVTVRNRRCLRGRRPCRSNVIISGHFYLVDWSEITSCEVRAADSCHWPATKALFIVAMYGCMGVVCRLRRVQMWVPFVRLFWNTSRPICDWRTPQSGGLRRKNVLYKNADCTESKRHLTSLVQTADDFTVTRSHHSQECTQIHAGTVFVPRYLGLLIPKQMGFQDSWWNIYMSSLVILAAAVFETSCMRTHIQTYKSRWKPYTHAIYITVGMGN